MESPFVNSLNPQARTLEGFTRNIEDLPSAHCLDEGKPLSNISELPNKMMKLIFAFLPRDKDIVHASVVCKKWEEVINGDPYLTLRRFGIVDYSFGRAKWEKYFGPIGQEPSLSSDIVRILSSPCPFWPNKKVRETHLLVLIPNTVNGNPFHLDALAELIQNPKTGHKTKYEHYLNDVKNKLGTKSAPSHWILMTRDVIPGSKYKYYDNQKALVQSYAQKSGVSYELPTILEYATVILMEYVETGTWIYLDNSWTLMSCQERVDGGLWQPCIGGSSLRGLSIFGYAHWGSGVGACRKL